MKSQSIDKYLSCGKEQPVNEGTFLSILTGFAIVRCIFCIWGLIQLYLFAVQVKRVSKFNMDLTKKLNKILGTTDHKVYIVPDESVNAFNLNGKTVYIFEGLFKLLTEGETLAILIHEVSHGTNHDAIKQMIKTELTSLVPSSAAASIIISVLGIMPISLVFALIAMKIIYGLSGNYWSRKDEYAADKLAIEKGYGEELANAFKKMLKAYHEPTKKPKKSYLGAIIEKILLLFSTHPDTYERIEIAMRDKETYEKAIIGSPWKALIHACNIVKIDIVKAAEEYKPLRNFLIKVKSDKNPQIQEID